MSKTQIFRHLLEQGWLSEDGAYVVVDGQYGSTGKGVLTGLLAECYGDDIDWVTSNAGPNSGHTSFYGDEKIVLKQLPTYPVVAWKRNMVVPAYLNAGAIIDMDTLLDECRTHQMDVHLHPHAALIRDEDLADDKKRISSIGSTGKGTGAALASKIGREPEAVVGYKDLDPTHIRLMSTFGNEVFDKGVGLVEVSQGFSLGLNSGFYPYTTSRECTVMQALSDARIHPSRYRQSMMVVRTYPIRVAGTSGPCYPDQKEIDWEMLGQEPELTTVTQKVRRVFTWSDQQFQDAVRTNKPEHIFVNFMNYLENFEVDVDDWVRFHIIEQYGRVMGDVPKTVLLGFGPNSSDVRLWQS